MYTHFFCGHLKSKMQPFQAYIYRYMSCHKRVQSMQAAVQTIIYCMIFSRDITFNLENKNAQVNVLFQENSVGSRKRFPSWWFKLLGRDAVLRQMSAVVYACIMPCVSTTYVVHTKHMHKIHEKVVAVRFPGGMLIKCCLPNLAPIMLRWSWWCLLQGIRDK